MSNVTVVKGEGPRDTAGKVVQKIKQQFEDQPWRNIGQSERIVSGIASVGLASMAMHSRSFLRALLMVGGAAGMAHRAYTGRCGFSRVGSRLGTMLNEQMSGQGLSGSDRKGIDQVGEASEESFPASDSPSFTPVTGSAASTETSSSNNIGSSRNSGSNHASNSNSTSNKNSNSTTKAGSNI